VERFVYNPKYAKLLISMSGQKAQIDELAKRHNVNAGHLRIVLDQWHKENVINKDRTGREYHISLTDKGEEVSKKLAELMDIVHNYEIKEVKKNSKKNSEVKKNATNETTEISPL